MHRVQVAQAKAQLSALLERVEGGEEILIARRGKAIARLIPERRAKTSAAEALAPVWALGGLALEAVSEPRPAEPVSLDD